VREVHVSARSAEAFEPLLGAERLRSLRGVADTLRAGLGTRSIWNVNSTESGGGVAEMLHSLVRYARGFQIDVRWLVLEAPPRFFRITKRVHNALHGSRGDGSPLAREEAELLETVAKDNAASIHSLIRPNDIVICHDPQTAGLVPHFVRKGALVVWRCHIGHEELDNEEVHRGWAFLRPYLEEVPIAVFSRAAYAPSWLRGQKAIILPPNIDPFSAKNQAMDEATIRAILVHVGLVEGPRGPGRSTFVRDDGSMGRVDREADVVTMGRSPSFDTPLVVQVSRWDAMKDPIGVLKGFARLVDPEAPRGAELVLA